jgi:hypothetical protein
MGNCLPIERFEKQGDIYRSNWNLSKTKKVCLHYFVNVVASVTDLNHWFFNSFYFIVVLDRGILWYLQRFLQYIKCIILEFTLSSILFYLPSPIQEIVATGIFFPFTFMCTQYLHHTHPLTPFPYLLPSSHWYQ